MTEAKEIIIIRRKREASDHSHHGGVWKVAFADFMTAMMAFFLVLWIVNSTSKETRSSIARYFNPIRLSDTTPARKGLLDPKDTDFDDSSPKTNSNVPSKNQSKMITGKSKSDTTIEQFRDEENGPGDVPAEKSEERVEHSDLPRRATPQRTYERNEDQTAPYSSPQSGSGSGSTYHTNDSKTGIARNQEIEDDRTRIQESIAALIDKGDPTEHLRYPIVKTERTPEGILISVSDLLGSEMFQSGSVKLNRRSIEVIEDIARKISSRVKSVVVSGYTDSVPVRNDTLGNWRLSVLRADAAMRVLIGSAIENIRVERIDGYADTRPKSEYPSYAPENRRVTILLRYATQ
jgi:chemotaxis protein MotB